MKWIYCILLSLGGSLELAQHMLEEVRMRPWSANIIIPQSRVLAAPRTQKVQMTHIRVFVSISHQVATTTMEIDLKNPTSQAQEAELLVPIPAQVVVRSFTFQGNGPEASAQLLPKKEAEALYRSIVSQLRDPALLEFLEYNVLRSSVFPVEAHGTQKIRLTYEQFLKAEGSRVDYLLPRTESIEYQVPWEVSVQIQTPHPLSTVYSPSHKLELLRLSPTQILAKIAPEAQKEPGTFFLSYLTKQEEITASLYSYPHPQSGGGYFLLFAGLPPQTPQELKAIKREVLLVFDRSGSMHSEKLDQIRSAALQIISGLEEDETFNILIYNEYVDFFSPHSLPPTPENLKAAQQFLKAVRAQGGTNIHDALLESLRQKPKAGALSFVLFLTDGLPTIGQTSEIRIRQMALKANIYQKRIFTFGVGVDVNTPLLEQVSGESRGSASFVLPKEDVEIKVSQVFKRLCGPI
jgi:Ca-activated chloride channel family protein